ncbi:MAG TPA: LytTR family DNA-binding domain-containing protein [Chitinophagaceae bacterium]|nr:LytTR family DNA-binding domain-containing protein [Chitinophagaceae bacterium]
MMTCIAIDDEPLALKLLEDNIAKAPFLRLVASCRDAFEALKVLQEQPVDLVFVDIQMPGLTGLQFIASLPRKPQVILITAYRQYALEGFDLDVVDYLVKPVPLERFLRACNRAREIHELQAARQQGPAPVQPDYFFLPADYSQVKIQFRDILYMEGLRDYVKIYLKSSPKPLLFRASLKSIEPELPAGKFIRIHKSYIVAVESITAIRKKSVFIGSLELPVGDAFSQAIDRLLRPNG